MSDDDNTMVYLATDKCGCNVGVIVDNPEHQRDTAKEVGRWIRDGLTVRRITLTEFRPLPFGHKCEAKKPKPKPVGRPVFGQKVVTQ